MIANVAHRAAIHEAELDGNVRAQLADDLLTLDEELGTLHTLLVGPVDWDTEFRGVAWSPDSTA